MSEAVEVSNTAEPLNWSVANVVVNNVVDVTVYSGGVDLDLRMLGQVPAGTNAAEFVKPLLDAVEQMAGALDAESK